MAWSETFSNVNYYVLAYILAVIVITMYTLNVLYRSGRLTASVAVFILFLLIFVFFGLRWFKYGLAGASDYPGTKWPPVINTCPDYFSAISDGSTTICIDTVGVSKDNRIQRWNAGDSVTNVTPTKKFTTIYSPNMKKASIATLKTKADENNVSWEGITDELYSVWAE